MQPLPLHTVLRKIAVFSHSAGSMGLRITQWLPQQLSPLAQHL